MIAKNISPATLSRIPTYLNYLRSIAASQQNISATMIAKALNLGEVTVRKDLSAISDIGKPRVGYSVRELCETIESFLGFDWTDTAIIVGAGKLGRALLDYDGFSEYGMAVSAAFDKNPSLSGKTEGGKHILAISAMKEYCKKGGIRIGILTVPASAAQQVCNEMVDCGITAILNFAPVHLVCPEGVTVQNENIATSLAMLSKNAGTRK